MITEGERLVLVAKNKDLEVRCDNLMGVLSRLSDDVKITGWLADVDIFDLLDDSGLHDLTANQGEL